MRTLLTKANKFSEVCPSPLIRLDTFSQRLGWMPIPFLIDTGSDFCMFPANSAAQYGIGTFKPDMLLPVETVCGTAKGYYGKIKVRCYGGESNWTCFFTQSHRSPEKKTGKGDRGKRFRAASTLVDWQRHQLFGLERTPVIGLAGFLREYSAWIDDEFVSIYRHGGLIRLIRWILGFLVTET